MLVGGVALAQQGIIIEPWRKAPAPAAAPTPVARAMPASGLAPLTGAAPVVRSTAPALPASPQAQAPAQKWSPPVVELLVDPWARGQVSLPVTPPSWVPSTVEIVDPWADDAESEPPRVASRPAGAQHSTIF